MGDNELFNKAMSLYKSAHEDNKVLFDRNITLTEENIRLKEEIIETRKIANYFRLLVKSLAEGELSQEDVCEIWERLLDQAEKTEEIENAQDAVVREALALISKQVNK